MKSVIIVILIVYALVLNTFILRKEVIQNFNQEPVKISILSSDKIDKALKEGCFIQIRKGNARFVRSMNNLDFAFVINKDSTFHIDSSCWNESKKGTFYKRAEFIKPAKKLSSLKDFFK